MLKKKKKKKKKKLTKLQQEYKNVKDVKAYLTQKSEVICCIFDYVNV